MSYAMAAALQKAVYQRLSGDGGIGALVGDAIYDVVPAGQLPETYLVLGDEEARDLSDKGGAGALHRFSVAIVTSAEGFASAKTLAGAVCDALLGAAMSLERGRLVGLWFERAAARRVGKADRIRRIELRFRARVEDD